MMKRIDLTNWQIAPHYPYTPFRARNLETDIQNQSILPAMPAKVPGSIYDDLQKAGVIEDPFFEMNSLKAQWVASHWWVYSTNVELQPGGDGRTELVFEGIDYLGHVFFNGQKLGETDNMYTPYVYDVTDKIREGSNNITVVLENAPDEIGEIGYTSQTFTQKARFNYKWDWCTRLISIGLYRPAYLRIYDNVRLEDFYFKPVGMNGDAEFYATLHGDTAGCTVRIEIGDFQTEMKLNSHNEAKTRLHVNNVKLWWPLDEGEQNLYDLAITILRDGKEVDTIHKNVGFRQFELTPNDDAPMGAFNYVFTCNGRRIYAKGVNMTPIDMSCYNDPAKMETMLKLAKQAHINVLRIWGGGVIEDDIFYDLCDRMGFMVWQEFIQSSSGLDNIPSKREIFLERLERTAQYATKTLRNHPSLMLWSGGNELNTLDRVPSKFSDRNLGMLLGIVQTNSPHTPMLPTSWSGPNLGFNPDTPGENHDIHGGYRYGDPVHHYARYNDPRMDGLFHGEFGVDGMASVETLKTFLSEEHLHPTDMKEDFVWRHHGEWWDIYARDAGIFGVPETLEQMVARSQFIQADGLRYIVESNRRRSFHNSGSVIWQINEPYPNVSCTSMLDYRMNPKPVFWQIGKAFAPLTVSVKYDKLVWNKGETIRFTVYLLRDGEPKETRWSYTVGDRTVSGESVCGNGYAIELGEITAVAEGKFVDIHLHAEDGTRTFKNTVRMLIRQENGFCSDEGLADFYRDL